MLNTHIARGALAFLSFLGVVHLQVGRTMELPLVEMQVVAPAPERSGVGPGGVVFVNSTTLATLDIVRQKVLLVDVRGRILRELPLPEGASSAIDIHLEDLRVVVRASGGEVVAELAASENALGSLDHSVSPNAGAKPSNVIDAVRLGANGMLVRVGGGGTAVILPFMTGSRIASVNGASVTKDGGSMIWWEEIGEGVVSGDVDAWVARFDSSGSLVDAVRVPLELADQLPRQYVAISGNGDALFQGSSGSTVFLVPLPLVPSDAAIKNAREIRSARSVAMPSLGQDFESLVRRLSLEEAGLSARATPTPQRRTRDEILAEARRHLNMTWTLEAINYAHDGLPSQCADRLGLYWQRPGRLELSVGKKATGMPYRWGGSSTPESFAKNLAAGRVAGDVCTCRDKEKNYCIVAAATGADCSGFISNVWGSGRHTTSSLGKVSSPLKSLLDLLPGDALNNAGAHVRLFVRYAEGPQLGFVTLESAVSCGGVCERTYTAAQLKNYKPIRYRYLKH